MRTDRIADELWAILLNVRFTPPSLDASVRSALGGELREHYRSVLDAPSSTRALELLKQLSEAGTVDDGSVRQATAAAR